MKPPTFGWVAEPITQEAKMPAHLIQLSLCEGAKPKERVLLKPITSMDDLQQLYFVLKAEVEDGRGVTVEVWSDIQEIAASLPANQSFGSFS